MRSSRLCLIPALFWLVLLIASTGYAQDQSSYFAHFVSGTIGALSVRAELTLTNTSASKYEVTLAFRDSSGIPLAIPISGMGLSSSVRITLAPEESRVLSTGGEGSLLVGSVSVSHAPDVCVLLALSFLVGGRPATQIAYRSSVPVPVLTAPVDSAGPFATALAVHNPYPEPAIVSILLRDSDGNEAGYWRGDLPGFGQMARYVAGPGQLFPDVGEVRGSVEISSTRAVVMLALRQRSEPLRFALLPAIAPDEGRRELVLPHVADGQYPGGTYRSTILLVNDSDAQNRITLEPHGDAGLLAAIGFPGATDEGRSSVELGPRAAAILESTGRDVLKTGAILVTSTGPLCAGAIMSAFDGGGATVSDTGILETSSVSDAVIQLDGMRGADAGLAFFNPGDRAAKVNLYAVDNSGTPVSGSTAIDIPARGHVARFSSTLLPRPESGNPAALVIVASQPVSIAALAWSRDPEGFSDTPVCAAAHRPALIVKNGVLIDGTGRPATAGGTVAIRAGRIIAAGTDEDVVSGPADQLVDVGNRAVLPGFFNAHVHYAHSETNLAAWAQAGITTVRDLGLDVKDWPHQLGVRSAFAGRPGYARIIASGPMMTVPGGYPMARWGLETTVVESAEEALQKTNQLLDEGADIIKIGLEAGYCCRGSGWSILSPEETAAITAAAHRRRTRVSAHISESSMLDQAIDGGADDLAHMVVDDALPDGLISKVIERGLYWVPTLELWSGAGNWFAQNSVANLRRFVAAGGRVALGTDYYGAPRPLQLGMPMIEIRLMSDAGMSPMQIIVAATGNAAHVSNCEALLGTLQPGKIADVLVVDGNPLADLEALQRPWMVIQNGVVIRGNP